MIMSTEDKAYQKLLKSGSVLKGLRSAKGGGLGCIAGGITLLVFGVLLFLAFYLMNIIGGGLLFLGMFGIPAIPLILIGMILRSRRNSTYVSFYQKETGFSEEEIRQIDRELTSPSVRIIGYIRDGGSKNYPLIACLITDHYFVTEGYYVRRLEDMIAAVYTDRMPWMDGVLFGLLFLSKQDTEAYFSTFATASSQKEALCMEILQELQSRNPEIIQKQMIMCNGTKYNLMNDSKEIVRLYQEGHKLEGVTW